MTQKRKERKFSSDRDTEIKPPSSLGDMKHWRHSVHQFMFSAEEVATNLIKEYAPLVYGEGNSDSKSDIDIELISSIHEDFKAGRELTHDEDIVYHKLFAASEALIIINAIRYNHIDYSKWELAWLGIVLGSDHHQLTADYVSEEVRERIRSEICRRDRKAQHDINNQKIDERVKEALAIANVMWARGDQYSYSEMREYLIFEKGFKDLNAYKARRAFSKVLRPLAKQYNRLRKRPKKD